MRTSHLLTLAPLLLCLTACIACSDLFFMSPKDSIYLAGTIAPGGAYIIAGHGDNHGANFLLYEWPVGESVHQLGRDGDIIARGVAPASHQLFYVTGNATGNALFPKHPVYNQNGYPNYLFNPSSDLFLTSVISSGSENWGMRFHGSGPSSGNAVITDDKDNLYMAGDFTGSIDLDLAQNGPGVSSVGTEDAFLCKYDDSETLLWTETLGGSDTATFNSLALGRELVYAAGGFTGQLQSGLPGNSAQSSGEEDFLICSYDPNGVPVWGWTVGGTGKDYVNSIDVDSDGNIYFTGVFENDVTFDTATGREIYTSNGDTDALVGKIDPTGNLQWIRTWGGSLADEAFSLVVEPETGSVYIVGEFRESAHFTSRTAGSVIESMGGSDAFICKFDSDGNPLWIVAEGSPAYDSYRVVMIKGDGNIIAAGTRMNNGITNTYTPDGSYGY
jgi:hypothetical protein